ncbi:unnamed protein product [Phaedon cochleariae]|uniref:Uncharacterized protein n=1 Tax=Phaedon cochleariae TaxID=80249 RepID=A0A9N9SH76_PHACE|nr:unnamed protein product [Phaedon cochleariae]
MADGLCSGEPFADVMEKTAEHDIDNALVCEKIDSVDGGACENVKNFYMASESAKLFDKLYVKSGHEGFLCEEDCRKKRCVDRYDSSESSDREQYKSVLGGSAVLVETIKEISIQSVI